MARTDEQEEIYAALWGAAIDLRYEQFMDEIARRAGLVWDHVGCWTNGAGEDVCDGCGRTLVDLQADEDEEVLTT